VERPSTFAELQDAADRQLALLEQQALGQEMASEDEQRLREQAIARRVRDRRLGMALMVPGAMLQAVAHRGDVLPILLGAALAAAGGAYWLRAKGRDPWLGLLAVFPLIGLVVVGTLKDRRAKELNLPD
jgi:hypothetical protein